MLSFLLLLFAVLIPIEQARFKTPIPVSRITILRWIKTGLRGFGGKIVRLRAEKVGGRWCTSLQWLDDFRRETQAGITDTPQLVDVNRAERVEKAKALLDELLK